MKQIGILIILLTFFLTACSTATSQPSESNKLFYRSCQIVVEMVDQLKDEGKLTPEAIKYFNSEVSSDNVEQLRIIEEKMKVISKVREDYEHLVAAKSSIEIIDKLIYYSVKYKDSPKEYINLLTDEERLDLSGAFVGSKTALRAYKEYIEEYNKKYGVSK